MAKSPKKNLPTTPLVDHALIHELTKLLNETGLTEIEIEQNGQRVRVARRAGVAAAPPPAPLAVAAPAPTPQPVTESAATPVDLSKNPGVVSSPMVGTAYVAAEPGAKPFIEIGSKAKVWDTVLIVEAIKTIIQIPSPRAGTGIQILIENGQPVEFGEPLVIIE